MGEMKRLNVIGNFENKVDEHLKDEYYPLRIHGRMQWCIVVPKDTQLNGTESRYIEEHFKQRKSYKAKFVKLKDIARGKSLLTFNQYCPTAIKQLTAMGYENEEDEFFMVSRSTF